MALKLFNVHEWGEKVINKLNTLTAIVNNLAAGTPAGTYTAGNGIDISGTSVISTAPVGSKLKKTASQSMPQTTPTIVTWQDTDYDWGGGASGSEYIIQGDGFYTAQCGLETSPSDQGLVLEILVNGIYAKSAYSTSSIHLVDGDIVTVRATNTINAYTILVHDDTYFSVTKVG